MRRFNSRLKKHVSWQPVQEQRNMPQKSFGTWYIRKEQTTENSDRSVAVLRYILCKNRFCFSNTPCSENETSLNAEADKNDPRHKGSKCSLYFVTANDGGGLGKKWSGEGRCRRTHKYEHTHVNIHTLHAQPGSFHPFRFLRIVEFEIN
ncbi:unnamed protein product [Ixodes pacificus]